MKSFSARFITHLNSLEEIGLEVRESPLGGYGIFANKDLRLDLKKQDFPLYALTRPVKVEQEMG